MELKSNGSWQKDEVEKSNEHRQHFKASLESKRAKILEQNLGRDSEMSEVRWKKENIHYQS